MASTWSQLKFELIGTGDQSGTWGNTTNDNLGIAIQQAIGGKADVTMSSTTITLTLTDTTALQDARALYLNLTGTPGGAATLNVPAVQKAYIVYNNTTGGFAVTVKVSGQTGVSVPNGKSMLLYDNGTDVVDAVTHLSSLTLGSPLPVASGGLGVSSGSSGGVLYFSAATTTASSGTLSANSIVLGGGAGNPPVTTTTGTGVVTAVGNAVNTTGGLVTQSGTLASSAILLGGGVSTAITSTTTGTGVVTAVGNAVNTTGGLVTQSGTLTANALLVGGGSGTAITSTTTGANVLTFLGTPSSANLASAVTDETGSGSLVFATSPTLVTPVLGTPTSGTLSNCTVDGTDAVGFRNIPQNIQTGSYTLVLADAGKHIYRGSGSAATWTIPANGSVAYPIGTALTFINLSATSVSIAITSDTMYLSSAGTTGTRTLAQYGSATAVKITSTSWIISGSGLT